MTHYDTLQQNLGHSQFGPQQGGWNAFGSQGGQPYGGLGQAAYGQQYGGQPTFGASGWGAQPMGWGQQWGGQQRQLSQQDVSEVVRQLVPALPQILAQAQTPFGGMGYAAYGQSPRQLSPQDVNEVVRQILPIVPQIVGMLQSQPYMQHSAMHGGAGFGQFAGLGQIGPGHPAQTWGSQASPAQTWGSQFGAPQFQAAFGGPMAFGQQRQLTQQDVADITRQLIGVLPQVIGNLQSYGQQRMM
ncbi:hypothetical protein JQ596_21175 [Bradyrhizobium manausense]|uniref:hypothetical protein n=1 Tax=Bradyrhizobium TaxID=374 RepID=UPI001BA69541|nr:MULTISPECIES: hypothetical protein [Bradyrhizobium]MBR0828050.1 hypothetical protein [Bradyrhizobium manausense]UVO32912.1 hypothetical protein KUF59_20980 [Bradyrhizobium arachidis]